jgi:hypothetical protein
MINLKVLSISALLTIAAGFSTPSFADGGQKYFDTSFDANMFCNTNSQYTTCNVTRVSLNLWKVVYSTTDSGDDTGSGNAECGRWKPHLAIRC